MDKTPVTVGWVVMKRFTKKEQEDGKAAPTTYEKKVSKRFAVRSAAQTFCDLANKYPQPARGEHNVQYFVAEDGGYDSLSPAL